MKKQLFNPVDMFFARIIFLCSIATFIGLIITTIICVIDHPLKTKDLLAVIIMYLLSGLFIATAVILLKKYGGYFFVKENRIVFVKGKRTESIAISDIRWIEMKRYVRSGSTKGRPQNEENWQFLVRRKDEKHNLDFFVTNNEMFTLAEKYQIRVIPKYFADIGQKKLRNPRQR